VGVTDKAGLADQLKSNAAKLGISVNYDEAGKPEIKSDTGENITSAVLTLLRQALAQRQRRWQLACWRCPGCC
jgi:hypothetical protein